MTLGALAAAIGLMIDDAVVMVEQLHRVGEDHPDYTPGQVVNRSVAHLLPALVGSSLSTIVIFLPFALLGGVAGAYFKVLATTMVVALICSFFVAWLGLPVLYLLLSKASTKASPPSPLSGREGELASNSSADSPSSSGLLAEKLELEEKLELVPPLPPERGLGGEATREVPAHHEIPWVRSVIRHPAYSVIGVLAVDGSALVRDSAAGYGVSAGDG